MNDSVFAWVDYFLHLIILLLLIIKAKYIIPELRKESKKALFFQGLFILFSWLLNHLFPGKFPDLSVFWLFIFYFLFYFVVVRFVGKFFPKFRSLYPYDEKTSFKITYYGFIIVVFLMVIINMYQQFLK